MIHINYLLETWRHDRLLRNVHHDVHQRLRLRNNMWTRPTQGEAVTLCATLVSWNRLIDWSGSAKFTSFYFVVLWCVVCAVLRCVLFCCVVLCSNIFAR